MQATANVAVALAAAACVVASGQTNEVTPLGQPAGEALQGPALSCDVESSSAICIGHGQFLLPPALPEGIVGFWPFDEATPVDVSGNRNHCRGTAQAGPSLAGQGSSVLLHHSFLTVPSSTVLDLRDFSYTFWLFLIEAPGGPHPDNHSCTLVRKGLDHRYQIPSEEQLTYAGAPAILFDRASRRLRLEMLITSADDGAALIESFESNSRLSHGRWFHVAVIHVDNERTTRLYVNGVLDTSMSMRGFVVVNQEALYIGGDPFTHGQCGLSMYIDELKIYRRPLIVDEIQAEASPSLSGIEPAFVRLGCMHCSLQAAVQSCPEGFHVCTSVELHMAGYQVARTLGWLQKDTHVWSHAGILPQAGLHGAQVPAVPTGIGVSALHAEPTATAAQQGLGLCCANY